MTPILALLFACVTPDPPPPVPVAPPPPPAGQRIAKSKSKEKAKGAGAGGAAIGVAGPGVLEMTVQTTDTSTTATMAVTFADGSSRTLPLGTVPGKCAEVQPEPVSQGGREVTPLYSFRCEAGANTAMGHVAQVDDQLVVVQVQPSATGTPKMKILKRVALVPGVVLARKA